MFDIGWSEFAVIAVVALIAIGPKELPGVLRMVGQWMGKARKMAAEFQGQFQEAMREAEMADLKKSFDEVREAATGFTSNNVMTSLQKDVGEALRIDDVDKPAISKAEMPVISETETSAISSTETAATSGIAAPVTPTEPQAPIPDAFTATDAKAQAAQPLAITRESEAEPAPQDVAPAVPDVLKDAKAS
jgi:sec-independent protein translocase protein TatB